MTDKLPMTRLKALMPKLEEAEIAFERAIEQIRSNEDFHRAVAAYNKVLEKAIDAIYEDTADRNSRSTLEQVYRGKGSNETHFGHNPMVVLRRWAEMGAP